MKITLRNFETAFPNVIVQRGADYHFMGAVGNVACDGNTYVATVYGSDEYTVEIDIQGGKVGNWFCDCPYDGEVCKHVVATLFEIRNEAAGGKTETVSEDKTLSDILDQLDKKELKALLHFFAQRDDEVRVHLITKYAHLIKDTGKGYYKSLVKSIISAHSRGKHAFIEYKDADRLGHELWKLISDAVENVSPGGEKQLVYLCEEAIIQLAKAFQAADDSSGGMGSAMEAAFNTLFDLLEPERETAPEVLEYLYQLGVQEHKAPIYQGWDWAASWREIAARAVQNQQQADAVITELEAAIQRSRGEGFSARYETGLAAEQKLYLLEQWYPEQASAYLEDHLNIHAFRKKALEQALENKQFDHTIAVIYLEENQLDALVEMLRSTEPSLSTLDQYAPSLAEKYSEEYRQFYAAAVRRAMDEANNRQAYRSLIPYLNKIKNLGGEAAALELAAEWRRKHPRRVAMLEELKKAGW